jgi:hypothetical protein
MTTIDNKAGFGLISLLSIPGCGGNIRTRSGWLPVTARFQALQRLELDQKQNKSENKNGNAGKVMQEPLGRFSPDEVG